MSRRIAPRVAPVIASAVLAGACGGPAPPRPAPPAAAGSDRSTFSESLEIERFSFDAQGESFLGAIASRRSGVPRRHVFVEVRSGDGTWQGEALHHGDATELFLEPAGRGGPEGWHVRGPAGLDPARVVELLPDVTGAERDSPRPEIVFVRAARSGGDRWTFDVTLSYPDTGWDDYADGWHVETPDGEILLTRILLHPHVGQSPFTRSAGPVRVPSEVREVVVRAHDRIGGYGPDTVSVPLRTAARGTRFEVVR